MSMFDIFKSKKEPVAPVQKPLKGHAGNIWHIEPLNEKTVATVASDLKIKIWDIQKDTCINTIDSHKNNVTCVKGIPNTYNIVSVSLDKTVQVHNYNTSLQISKFTDSRSNWALLNISNSIFAIGENHAGESFIKLWDVLKQEPHKVLKQHDEAIKCLERLSDQVIASGSDDKTIKIWNIESGECTKTIQAHEDRIQKIKKFNEKIIISVSNDMFIKFWDFEQGQNLLSNKIHEKSVRALEILNENCLYTGSDDKKIKFWKIEKDAKEKYEIKLSKELQVSEDVYSLLSIFDDKNKILVGGSKPFDLIKIEFTELQWLKYTGITEDDENTSQSQLTNGSSKKNIETPDRKQSNSRRSPEVTLLESTIEDQGKEIQVQIDEHEQILKEKDELLKGKDDLIQQKNHLLEQQSLQIKDGEKKLNKISSEKDKEIKKIQQIVKEKESELQLKEEQLQKLSGWTGNVGLVSVGVALGAMLGYVLKKK